MILTQYSDALAQTRALYGFSFVEPFHAIEGGGQFCSGLKRLAMLVAVDHRQLRDNSVKKGCRLLGFPLDSEPSSVAARTAQRYEVRWP